MRQFVTLLQLITTPTVFIASADCNFDSFDSIEAAHG